jgi:hypothetical protein
VKRWRAYLAALAVVIALVWLYVSLQPPRVVPTFPVVARVEVPQLVVEPPVSRPAQPPAERALTTTSSRSVPPSVPSPISRLPRVVPAAEAVARPEPATKPVCPGPDCPSLEPPLAEPPECGEETVLGRCEGDRIVLCHGGQIQTVECAGRGMICVVTSEEGAVCRDAPEEPCDESLPRCAGKVLELCREGETHRVDCGEHEASCQVTEDGGRCLKVKVLVEAPAPPGGEECGPCGCPTDREAPAPDKPLKVLPFLVTSTFDDSRWGDEGAITQELAVAASLLEPSGITLEVGEVRRIKRSEWLVADNDEVLGMLTSLELHPDDLAYYVPVVFTDALRSGFAPRLGVSASNSDGRRVVVVAHARHWTTTAHEIGHFLTLAHTHANPVPVVTRVEWPGGSTECDRCKVEGDRICDTPEDPGREECSYSLPGCEAQCTGGWVPDVTNLMSYYHDCRRSFSPEQIARMRTNLTEQQAAWQARRALEGLVQPTPE